LKSLARGKQNRVNYFEILWGSKVSTFFHSALIRSRLIRYFEDKRALAVSPRVDGRRYAVRDLLDELVISEATTFLDEHSQKEEDEAIEALKYSIKHDSLERFLSQKQYIERGDILANIAFFLRASNYISIQELRWFWFYPEIPEVLHLTQSPKIAEPNIKDGEYVSISIADLKVRFSDLLVRKDHRRMDVRAFQRISQVNYGMASPFGNSPDRPFKVFLGVEVIEKVGFFYKAATDELYLIQNDSKGRINQCAVRVISDQIGINIDKNYENHVLLLMPEVNLNEILRIINHAPVIVAYSPPPQDNTYYETIQIAKFNIVQSIRDSAEHYIENIKYRKMMKDIKNVLKSSFKLDNSDITAQLFEAGRLGDLDRTLVTLCCGANIARADPENGNTILHIAASNGALTLLEVLSTELDFEHRDVRKFVKSIAALGITEEQVEQKLRSVLSQSPISAKNFDGLTPSAYIGPVKMNPSSKEEHHLHDAWQDAMQREAKAIIKPDNWTYAWMDYVMDNKFGQFMPYLGTTPPKL
jgi:ribosomal protein L12E/L44/L45/RPP1/RPP2